MRINALTIFVRSGILLFFVIAVLLHIFWIRPWYRAWGIMPEERSMALPGNKFIPPHSDVTARAITIMPADIAPLPKLEPLKVGDPVSMMGGGPLQTNSLTSYGFWLGLPGLFIIVMTVLVFH